MKIENTEVYGFRAALRGMRNPMNSWHRSSSRFRNFINEDYHDKTLTEYKQLYENEGIIAEELPFICSNDMKLALALIRHGSEHRKFLRMICIWVDLTLPRYMWQEVDTYKIGTVRNSCSTMHKLGSRFLEFSDFGMPITLRTLDDLNDLIDNYKEAEDKDSKREIKYELKGNLPEGYLQKATLSLNYEVALNMLMQRSKHRLVEWSSSYGIERSICEWILNLPYMSEFYRAAIWRSTKIKECTRGLETIMQDHILSQEVVEQLESVILKLHKVAK